MSWESHPAIISALKEAERIVDADTDENDPSDIRLRIAAVRQIVKITNGTVPNEARKDYLVAAVGMIAAGLHPNAGDVAWLVRDRTVGHPLTPSFWPKPAS